MSEKPTIFLLSDAETEAVSGGGSITNAAFNTNSFNLAANDFSFNNNSFNPVSNSNNGGGND